MLFVAYIYSMYSTCVPVSHIQYVKHIICTCVPCTAHVYLCSKYSTYVPVSHVQHMCTCVPCTAHVYLCPMYSTYVHTCVLSVVPYWPSVGWMAQRLGNDCREDEKDGLEEKKEQNRGKTPTGLYIHSWATV